MRRGILFLALLVAISATKLSAQKLDPKYYDYPLRNVAGYYSANFAEMRPNHFHSGIDFKTDGVEGKVVVAVADGYVSRVLYSNSGYGLALYVTHTNGTTSVYGHLSKFRKDIADFVFAERHRQKRSRIDVECKPDQFKVKRGEQIALSGNTGSSMGPHLHFEIRDNAGRTINLFSQGIYKPKDDISPYIMKVHYIEVDSVRGVPCHSRRSTYTVNKADNNTYRTAQKSPIKVGRKGYFVVETSDRKNDCANTYGVYNLKANLDGKTIYEYRNDGFPFTLSRYCNAVAYYPIQVNTRNEAMLIAMREGGTDYFYPKIVDKGVVRCKAGEKRQMEFVITDDCANTSTLSFEIEGKPDSECFKGEIAADAPIVEYNHDFAAKVDDTFSVVIPKGALYESIALENFRRSEIVPKADSTVQILSAAYTIHDDGTPLQNSVVLIFSVPVAKELQAHTTMASVSSSGRVYNSGGNYKHNRLVGRTRTFGTYCLVADTTPPTIRPLFDDGADCTKRDYISFRLSDNFAGVSSYSASIDGKWVPIEYSRGRATINLRAEGIKGNKDHKVEITIRDSCGNRAKWSGSIKR